MRILLSFSFLSLMAIGMAATDTEISLTHPSEKFRLGGTLTTPDNTDIPKAVLVFATGSGQQTRDEEVFGHPIFKEISNHLAAHGYATLRMDDRGIGASEGNFAGSTTDDFAGDIAAVLAYAKDQFPNIPAGILGHSEGGTIAIKLAAADENCSFIVTLAAPAWPGDSVIMSQARALAQTTTGTWKPESERLQRELLDICKSPLPTPLARPVFIAKMGENLGDAAALPAVQQQISASADAMLSEWYRQSLRYNPAADISTIQVPWLALNGDRDTQVLPENLTTISELNPGADIVILPLHNHLFQHCTSGLVTEYATISEGVSKETLSRITDWLDQKFDKNDE